MHFNQYDSLIDSLAKELKARGLAMCTAESCTGGLIAALCTSRPGSSEWFQGGVVSYTNDIKERVLGVPGPALAEYGAVSLPVAEAMAAGALGVCAAQVAVAVSGIAGPGGGSPEKPVGTVCIAAALRQGPGQNLVLSSERFVFTGGRDQVRAQAAVQALTALRDLLKRY